MAGRQSGLGRKKEQAIAALPAPSTIAEAAETAGIGEKTLRRWLHEPAFAAAYRTARRELVESAIVRVQQCSIQAVVKLHELMRTGSPGVQLKAAASILTFALRAVEQDDILTRIELLEGQGKNRSCRLPLNG